MDEISGESESETGEKTPGRWRRVRRIACWTAGLGAGIPLLAFWIAYLVLDVRSPQEVLAGLDKTVTLDYSDGSELLKVVPPDGDRLFVPYARIPAKLRDAIVATEDPTFWDNQGFDPTGVGRALLTGFGGGSGITQQYIKKSTGDDEHAITRKLTELVLATKITQEQSKEKIFESYVNIISFGRNTFGPAAAMNAFFGRGLDESLTWSEAAFLAGMIQSPSVHDPAVSGDEHAARRWEYVRDKLVERGYVKGDEIGRMSYPGKEIQPPSETRAGQLDYEQYHVKQAVLAELERAGFPLNRLRQGTLRVETTLDRRAQESARKTVKDRLAGEPRELRGALVSVDPGTGAVRVYDGGDDGLRDYAGVAHPAGSAFYPFSMLAGLRAGVGVDQPAASPSETEFLGERFKYPNVCGDPCTYRQALRKAADAPFVGLAKRLGADALSAAARDAGIPDAVDGAATLREYNSDLIGAGIAIGRYPLRPLDMAGAYATFAAKGVRAMPYLVEKIRDEKGEIVWQHTSRPSPFSGDDATSTRLADAVTDALRTTLPDGRPAALATGQFEQGISQDYAAAWAIGYTPKLVTAVWIGSDDDNWRLRDSRGRKITGATMPTDIWQTFMLANAGGRPTR
ncbi:transglycosylase domain-containing protein [Amycolatopsis sp. NPDC058986]|uniref:transglycosylase domain-containing protein n=1 Tax=unclassified Amycolatopsis TaxID=2618356 RepID=UPI00366DB224